MANELINAALAELHAAGIRTPTVSASGKHWQIRWMPPRGDRERVVTLSNTGSDHRAIDNARADVRRVLRADGLLTTTPERKPERQLSRIEQLERRLQRVEQLLQAANA